MARAHGAARAAARQALCAMVLVLAVTVDGTAACSHTFDNSGVAYDLSKLNNGTSPFYHTRHPFLYAFMVCGNLPAGSCGDSGTQCASAQYTAGGFYQSLGVASAATTSWQLLDSSAAGSGVSVTYGGGTTCHLPEAVVASTTIEVACDESAEAPTGFTYTIEQCSLTVSLRSMYGCPSAYTTGLSGGWVFLLLLLISSLVYLVGGIAYKKATLGTSGMESIPNIDFWREFWSNVVLGCQRSWAFVRCQPWSGGDDGYRQGLEYRQARDSNAGDFSSSAL